MIGFRGTKKKEEHFLTLDIGTEAVKTLVFKKPTIRPLLAHSTQEGDKIIVSGVGFQYFDRFGVFDSVVFEKDVIKKAILKAIEEAQNEAQIKTNLVFLGLPANILKARVLTQNFSRKTPQEIIDEEEKKEISNEIFKGAEREIAAREGILLQDIEFIDLKILETKIDGYRVPDLLRYDGRNLDFKILITFSFKHHLQNFKEILKELKLEILNITHLAQNLIEVFLNEWPDALFLDIGGEISQIFLAKNGTLELIEDFKMGGEDFSQQLCQNLGINLVSARELKERYFQRKLSLSVRKRIREIFREIWQDWLLNFQSKLAQYKALVPSNVFLFGGGSLLPEIEDILEKSYRKELSFLGEPEIKFIYPKDLKNIVDKTKKLNSPQNIPSLLICHAQKENF